jgi:fimbrial chaperone protein
VRALRSMAARLVLLLCLAFGQAETGWAATFTVNPVQVFLSAKTRSVILTLRNVSDETLRFQLDAFAWDQDARGEMSLQPTRDVVFFPGLLTLAPGEERNVRVGAATPPGLNEKTYRIFVEELPPPAGTVLPAGQVRVLTKVGIPIFIEPMHPAAAARVDDARLRGGQLSFEVRNTGTVHFIVQSVRLTGYGASGERVLEGAVDGWYVLPGGSRRYDLPLPAADCPKVRSLGIEVQTTRATVTERVDAPAGACTP